MSTPPTFEATAHVTDMSSASSIWWVFAGLCCIGLVSFLFVGQVIGLDEASQLIFVFAWIGTIASVVVGGLLFLFFLGDPIVRIWRRFFPVAKAAAFSSETSVRVNAQGFHVEGFGTVPWSEVLALEGIPDSHSDMLVHTKLFKLFVRQVDVVEIAPVINFYMEVYENATHQVAMGSEVGPYFFKAQQFRWPMFFTSILFGYLVGIIVLGAMLGAAHQITFPTLGGALMTAGFSTYCVWFLPFQRLNFDRGAIRAYQYSEQWLSTSDGLMQVDLSTAKVRRCNRSGVGYDLYFISILPAKGHRIDLLMSLPNIHVLTMRLLAAGIAVETDPAQPEHPDASPDA